MKLYKIAVVILYSMLTGVNGYGQTIPWDDLVKVNEVFLTAPAYTIQSTYTLYTGAAITPTETFKGTIKKDGANMYYKLGQTEIFINDKKQFLIQHTEKLAVINPNYSGDDKNYNLQVVGDKIDALKKLTDNIKYAESNGVASFKYYTKSGQPLLELYYNKTTYYITKMVVFKQLDDLSNKGQAGKENYKIIIEYNSVQLGTKNITPSDFSFDKYVVNDRGIYKLKPSYNQYTLVTN